MLLLFSEKLHAKEKLHILTQSLLLGGTYYFQKYHITDNKIIFPGRFPTQNFDEKMRDIIHVKQDNKSWFKQESTHSLFSDVALLGLTIPYGIHYKTMDDHSWLQLMHSMSLTVFITNFLKFSIRRPRPTRYFSNQTITSRSSLASFPSGHASTAFALASSALFSIKNLTTIEKITIGGTATAVALLRVSSDKHYFSDILAGGLIGYLSTWAVHNLFPNDNKNNTTLKILARTVTLQFKF